MPTFLLPSLGFYVNCLLATLPTSPLKSGRWGPDSVWNGVEPKHTRELGRPPSLAGALFCFEDLLKLIQRVKRRERTPRTESHSPLRHAGLLRRQRPSICNSQPKKLKNKNKMDRTETIQQTSTALNIISRACSHVCPPKCDLF